MANDCKNYGEEIAPERTETAAAWMASCSASVEGGSRSRTKLKPCLGLHGHRSIGSK